MEALRGKLENYLLYDSAAAVVSFTFTFAWLITHIVFHGSEIYYLMNVGMK